MAGESPGRSDQQKSSGETARGERDPRLAVSRDAEAAQGSTAVAVVSGDLRSGSGESGAKAETEAEAEPEAPAADESDANVSGVRDGEPGEGSGTSEAAPESEGEVKKDSGVSGGSPKEGVSEPDAEAEADADEAKADEAKTDKADGASEDGKNAGKNDRKNAGKNGDGDEPSEPSVDQRTAVFRTVQPRASEEDAAGKAEASDTGGGVSAEPVDRPTAAFGALPEKSGKSGKEGVDQPTTAFKAISTPAGKTDKATPDAKAPDAKTSDAKASGKKSVGESDNERTSKFVPLRSPEDPAPPRRPAAPAAPSGTAASAAVPEAERTKQQPLPPLSPDGKQPAPLDLLAQLTNTPPKPETPVRTAIRRIKIWTPLVVLLVIILGVVQALRPLPDPELKLTADATYRFGGDGFAMPWPDQGQSAAEVEGVGSLGTSGEQKPVPIASVTKVMTAYVVLKDHPLKAGEEGPKIKIDAQAAKEAKSADESRAAVKEGQTFTQHQLLQLLLINSSNNIARLLARWDAGSLDAFVEKMNGAAKSLGMKQTTYTDPSGLKESTKSTAADQLKLARAAMQSEAFRAVVATPNTEVPGLDDRIYNNNNLLVKPGVIGIKTGSSTPAGGALMWAAVRTIDGKKQRILGVVLEQRATTTLDASLQLAQTNSYKLITAVQDALTSATVIKKGDVVGQVDDGLGGTTPVVATKDLKAVGWSGLTVDIKIGDGGEKVPHSAKAGTVIGEVTVGTGPGQLTAPVALQEDLSEPSFGAKLTRIS